MAKLVLKAKPTFIAKVGIPVAGQEQEADVHFTFKHRTKDELDAWTKAGGDDVKMIMDMAEGWDLPEPFNEDTVKELVQNYYGAAESIVRQYLFELMKARRGN